MNLGRIYLDYNASAPLRPPSREALVAALEAGGNPSSVHAEGRAARHSSEEARLVLADLLGTEAKSIFFTSGATEALNLALTPTVGDGGVPICHLLVGAGEHPCVLEGHRFPPDQVRQLPLGPDGRLDLAALAIALETAEGRVLVALQAANNETGVLQPVAEAAALVHAAGGLLVCDAVQAFGRVPTDFAALGADMIVVSSHKLGGPKGAGLLAMAGPALHIAGPLLRGGGQERGARAGTENVAAIAGFAAAARAATAERETETGRLTALRDGIEARLTAALPDLVVFGRTSPRLPNTSALAVPGIPAETLLIALDLAGIAVSSGSACSSGKVRPSHVLAAMGVDAEVARGAIRVSLGWKSTQIEADGFCETFENTILSIRARRAVGVR